MPGIRQIHRNCRQRERNSRAFTYAFTNAFTTFIAEQI
jgi:hypothetical protein